MGLHKTSDEKLMLINEFFDSHLSIRQFCSKKGIPSSTFSTWIRLYNASINSQKNKNDDNNISTPSFFNVTELAKNNYENCINNSNLEDYVKKRNIKLNYNGIEMEFDLTILKNVLGVLND